MRQCDSHRHLRSWSGRRPVLWASLLGLAVAGCAPRLVEIEYDRNDIPDTARASTPIPLKLGVYYTPGFRTVTSTAEYFTLKPLADVARIGPSSVQLFDELLGSMFADVVPVAVPPPYKCNIPDVDIVLVFEPRDFTYGLGRINNYFPAVPVSDASGDFSSVTFAATLYAPSGQRLAQWTTDGSVRGGERGPRERRVRQIIHHALRVAAANFVIDLRKALAQPAALAFMDKTPAC